jgi:CRP/FNR family cyclic AMP-dependent transcriptional regulator
MMSELLRVTSRRLARASQLHAEFGASDAMGRVCGRLIEMAERYGRRSNEGVTIRSPLSQADIGAWAGISRESVVKALSTLRELGWVRTRGRRITLLEPDAVRDRGGLVA